MAYPWESPLEEGPAPIKMKNLRDADLDLQFMSDTGITDPSIFSDPLDFTNQYNTELEAENERRFRGWLGALSQREGRDLSEDLKDYDYRAQYLDLRGQLPEAPGTDNRYKKPNHMTFTKDSIYSGVDGYVGGEFQEGRFVVGETNMHDESELKDYFATNNPEIGVYDTRYSSEQTASLRAMIDKGSKYNRILTDAQIFDKAAMQGPQTIGEVFEDKLDLEGGDNVALKTVAGGLAAAAGALAAKGAAVGSAAGPVGTIVGLATGLVVGLATHAAAVWFSEKTNRNVQGTLLKLEADEFSSDAERNEAEKIVADWYNEKRLKEAREEPGILGMSVGTILDMFPYVAEMATGSGIVRGAVKGSFRVGSQTLAKKGFVEAIEQSTLKIDKKRAAEILEEARKEMARGLFSTEDEAVNWAMKKATEESVANFLGKRSTRLLLEGGVVQAIQQPRIQAELKERELESIYVDEQGKFQYDKITGGQQARKQALAYVETLSEMVGSDVAKFLYKKTGVQKALKPILEKIGETKPGQLGKAINEAIDKSGYGQHMKGRSRVMQTFYNVAKVNGATDEMLEELVSMNFSVIFGLDADERGDKTYMENVIDKMFFPVTNPKQFASMMIAFQAIPALAGAYSGLSGQATREQLEAAESATVNAVKFMRRQMALEEADVDVLVNDLAEQEEIKRTIDKMFQEKGNKPNAFQRFFRFLFDPMQQDLILKQLGLDAEGFMKAVGLHQARIEKDGVAEGDKAIELATRRAIADVLGAGIIVSDKKTYEALQEEDTFEISPTLANARIRPDGSVVQSAVLKVDRAKLESASPEVVKFLKDTPGIVYSDTGKPVVDSTNETQIDAAVLNTLKKGSSRKSKQTARDTIRRIVGEKFGVIIQGDGKIRMGGGSELMSGVATSEEAIRRIDEIVDAIEEMVNEPGGSPNIVVTDARIQKITEENKESLAAEFGVTGEVGSSTAAFASNIGNTIYITPLVGLEDPASKVLHEEKMEISYKKNAGGVALRRKTIKSMKGLVDNLTGIAANESVDEGVRKEAAKIAVEINDEIKAGGKTAFEAYIKVAQAMFSKFGGKFKDSLEIVLDQIDPAIVEELRESASISFDAQSGLDLEFREPTEADADAPKDTPYQRRRARKKAGRTRLEAAEAIEAAPEARQIGRAHV